MSRRIIPFCPRCGAQLLSDSIFCENCGMRIEGSNETSQNNHVTRNNAKLPLLVLAGGGTFTVIVIIVGIVMFSKGEKDFFKNPFASKDTMVTNENTSLSDDLDMPSQTITDLSDPNASNYSTELSSDGSNESEIDLSYEEIADQEDIIVSEPTEITPDSTADPTADQGYTPLSDPIAIANDLTTTDYANAMDFEWFLDYILFDGENAGQVIKDSSYTTQITGDMNALLNGGWKAYIYPDSFTSDGEHYFNAEINTSDDTFNITMNWKYFFDAYAGTSVEETGSDLFKGSWNASDGTATVKSNYGMVTFDAFYINADATAEYAIGTFEWISGEKDRIALMRTHES